MSRSMSKATATQQQQDPKPQRGIRQVDNINIPKELGRAAIAAIATFVAALILKALGTSKWLAAAGSGAIGGVAAIAVIA